jgi:hypothetical protein
MEFAQMKLPHPKKDSGGEETITLLTMLRLSKSEHSGRREKHLPLCPYPVGLIVQLT